MLTRLSKRKIRRKNEEKLTKEDISMERICNMKSEFKDSTNRRNLTFANIKILYLIGK